MTKFFRSWLIVLLAALPWAACYPAQDGEPIPVYLLQGEGASTAQAGRYIDSLGIVTAVGLEGFYLQDPTGDGRTETSDGIYVYMSAALYSLAPASSCATRWLTSFMKRLNSPRQSHRAFLALPDADDCAGAVAHSALWRTSVAALRGAGGHVGLAAAAGRRRARAAPNAMPAAKLKWRWRRALIQPYLSDGRVF